MKYIYSLGLLLFSLSASGQNFEISGKVQDSEDASPLESATLFVERVSDSTLVAYTISDKEGNFIIKGSDSSEELRLVGSFTGYSPLNKIILMDQKEIELGAIKMEVADNLLDEVMVVSTRAPVTVKTDTLEFNARSFNTRQDANLEDLMKKLPGVEVDAQGNITVNGTPVSRIMVNGKEFFGNDPKVATKNLPKEIIEKIQVVDTKTKTEEFTGKAGNPDDKTINITLQDDKNRGYFARATAGGGTDGRYEMSGIGNYFQDALRISALASSNNINSSGFSFDEVYDMMGGRGRSISFNRNGGFSVNGTQFGGSGGITKSESAGLNFTNEWNDQYELNADYFFGRNDTETRSNVETEFIRPGGNIFENSSSEGNFENDSHRASASFEIELDTLTKISVRPSITVNKGFSRSNRMVERSNEDHERTNSSVTFDNEELHSTNFNNRLNFIRRFGGRGAYLQAYFNNDNQKQGNENFFYSERNTYSNFELTANEVQDQFINEDNTSDEYRIGATQRSVLTEKLFLDISYDYSTEHSTNERNVFDLDEQTGMQRDFNEALSNDFEVRSVKHRPNVGLNYEGDKWRISFGVGYLNTSLENEDFLTGNGFDRNFSNLYMNSNLRYEIKRGANIYMYYRNDTDIPSLREMQPVADLTDPLHIRVGNPQLRPTFRHNFNLGYRNFDLATRSGFASYGSASIIEDQVVPVTTEDENISTTTYTNVDGGLNANLGSFYSKRFKKEDHEFNFRLGAGVNYIKQTGFAGPVQYNSERYGIRPSIRLGYDYSELIDFGTRYEVSYNKADLANRDEEYTNHTIGLDFVSYLPENVVFGNDISYNYYGNVALGFDPTSLLWNMSLGYKFMDDDATIKVKVYDLLNENVSTSRTTGLDFVQDSEELILEQYFMLSFTYKLSKFGGKDPNRSGGGMRRF